MPIACMSGKEKQERKQRLDSMLSNSLQETLERKAQYYKKKGMEKQAKKIPDKDGTGSCAVS